MTIAAFYYPWFPNAWNQQGFDPFSNYQPSLGYYESDDPAVIAKHIAALRYGGIELGIISWWGQHSQEDTVVPALLAGAEGTPFQWALYYESDQYANEPTAAEIDGDLLYIKEAYAGNSNYLKINNKPVLFVFYDGGSNELTAKWVTAAQSAGFYLVLKVYANYTASPSQPDSWHQYGPAVATDHQKGYSFTISPGYYKKGDASPELPRLTAAQWETNIKAMIASKEPWQLITTFNEWGEGTSVESGTDWSSASGYGTYLDVLNAVIMPPPPPTPPPTTVPTVTGLNPATGPVAGGTDVVITGTGFLSATKVEFGTVVAKSYVIVSDTEITAVSPPQTAGGHQIGVFNAKGRSAQNPSALFRYSGSAPPPPPPVLSLAAVPQQNDTIGVQASVRLSASGGSGNYVFTAAGLPPGLAIAGPVISGVPTTAGTFTVTATVADASNPTSKSASQPITFVVAKIPPPPPPPPPTDHGIMIVMMENQEKSNIVGASTAPNLNALINEFGSAASYFGNSHPSLPNYIAIATGSAHGVTDDNPPSSHTTLVGVANLFSQLDTAGIPWEAFFEGIGSNPKVDNGGYAVRHNPIAYTGSAAQLAKCQPYTESAFVTALNAAASNAFIWVTPNLTDDMHNSSVKVGDTFIGPFITAVQGTKWYQDGGVIWIIWDEAYNLSGSTVGGGFGSPAVTGGPVAMVAVAESLKGKGAMSGDVTHIGALQTIEGFYSLSLLGASGYGSISSLL